MIENSTPPEEQKRPDFVTPDLRILVEGTAEPKLFIKDKEGKEHRCYPLVVGDLIEFESEIGVSIYEIMNARIHLKHIVFLLWLSLRKEGCSQEDLRRRAYKIKRTDVEETFDGGFLAGAIETFMSILRISGFHKGKPKVNPPTPTNQPVSEVVKATVNESGNNDGK